MAKQDQYASLGRMNMQTLVEGSFNYSKHSTIYAQETFRVIKNKRIYSHTFSSEILSRTITGELLTFNVDYVVNKTWTPQHVTITKILGKKKVTENYEFVSNSNTLHYHFTDSNNHLESTQLIPPPHFHITTPSTSTGFIFLLTKKFDINPYNDFYLYGHENQWEYKGPPLLKEVSVKRAVQTSDIASYESLKFQTSKFQIFDKTDHALLAKEFTPKQEKGLRFAEVLLTSRFGLPFKIIDEDNITIQLTSFKEHDDD